MKWRLWYGSIHGKFWFWSKDLRSPEYLKDERETAWGEIWATSTVYRIQEHMQENVIFDKYGVWWVKEEWKSTGSFLPHAAAVSICWTTTRLSAPSLAGEIFRQSCHVAAQLPSKAVFTCGNVAISHSLFDVFLRFVFTWTFDIFWQLSCGHKYTNWEYLLLSNSRSLLSLYMGKKWCCCAITVVLYAYCKHCSLLCYGNSSSADGCNCK